MVDDPVVPAHGGEEGVIERGPGDVSHKVSVGSASEPRTEKFEHGRGQGGKPTWGGETPHPHTHMTIRVGLLAGGSTAPPRISATPVSPDEVVTPAGVGIWAAQIRQHIEAKNQVHFRCSMGCPSPPNRLHFTVILYWKRADCPPGRQNASPRSRVMAKRQPAAITPSP